MSQAARYLFDLDFSAPPEPEIDEEIEEIPPEPMITVAEHEQLLAAAIEQARAEGEAKVREDRDLQASEERLKVEKAILDEVGMIYTEVGTLLQRLERDASKLAFTFASRFAERLVAQEPKVEIMALLNQILAPLRETPHISIRVSEDIVDEINEAVEAQMNELGFKGSLKIIPDPLIMAGDCEVEWTDGGIGRNLRAAVRQVEQLLEDHFAHVPESEDDAEEEDDTSDELGSDDAQQEAESEPENQSEPQDTAQVEEQTPSPIDPEQNPHEPLADDTDPELSQQMASDEVNAAIDAPVIEGTGAEQ